MIPLCFPKIGVHLQFFEKQIEIKLLHSASTEEITDSGKSKLAWSGRTKP
ncbi:MAG: hypothetical protein P8X79_05700 [Reinekea sp.]